MKQIFDWLREQFEEDIEQCETHGINKGFNRGIIGEANKGLYLIDEAEAKWEAKCKRADFEYRINDVLPMLEEKYLYGTASLIKAMADALGIKISEVE